MNWEVDVSPENAMKKMRSNETSIEQRLVKHSRAGDGLSEFTTTSFDCSDLQALNMENTSLVQCLTTERNC